MRSRRRTTSGQSHRRDHTNRNGQRREHGTRCQHPIGHRAWQHRGGELLWVVRVRAIAEVGVSSVDGKLPTQRRQQRVRRKMSVRVGFLTVMSTDAYEREQHGRDREHDGRYRGERRSRP